MAFSIFTKLYVCSYNKFQNIAITPKEALYPLAVTLPGPGNHQSTWISVDLPVVDISYKGHHTVCDTLRLDCLTWRHFFEILPWCGMDQYFCPFSGWIIFHCMDRPHFIYPFYLSTDTLVPSCVSHCEECFCEHSLRGFVWMSIFFPLGFTLGNGIVGSYGISGLNYLKNASLWFL